MNPVNIFWFRRDLRLDDNRGLTHALEEGLPVLLLFIFDENILNELVPLDSRVTFIHNQLNKINLQLKKNKTSLLVKHGKPQEVWSSLMSEFNIKGVFTNHDYEPYARERDEKISKLLKEKNITFKTYKDQVLLEKDEVIKDNGDPYVVFTPYSRQWRKRISEEDYLSLPSTLSYKNYLVREFEEIPTLEQIGFNRSECDFPSSEIPENILQNYEYDRDFPAKRGTSRIGLHLRFGTVSIRKIASAAKEKSQVFLNELIWREFYQMILWHFPRVVHENFQTKYNRLQWRNNEEEFDTWCTGRTGYPIVDAGMRQLNTTGFMHNRVRMIVASFLTKHLLIDWRWGEAYFAEKLLDYELASNNGGWQWAAGTGVDAAPYFRVFNPELQMKKFDPELKYVKQWVPEYNTPVYPRPMVDHKEARNRAIEIYKQVLAS